MFGFADLVESHLDQVWVRFDVLTLDWLEILRATRPGEDRLMALRELPTYLLEIETKRTYLKRFLAGRLEEDRWYRLVLGEDGIASLRFNSLTGEEPPEQERVREIVANPVEADELARLVSLDDITTSDQATIQGHLPGRLSPYAASYNVGQGSCGAACEASGRPQVYLDLGGGVTTHSHTYPASFQICHNDQTVILSHWDTDHWSTADRDPQCLGHSWIAPIQALGPTHARFASRLHQQGNLYLWPPGLTSVNHGSLTIFQCTGSGRNNSGLGVRVDLPPPHLSALFPGDAAYSRVPLQFANSHSSLVASHHGSSTGGRPPNPSGTQVTYSYGHPNSYGHPHAIAIQRHQTQGWTHRLDTRHGSVLVGPAPGSLPVAPPCSSCPGGSCSLNLVQS